MSARRGRKEERKEERTEGGKEGGGERSERRISKERTGCAVHITLNLRGGPRISHLLFGNKSIAYAGISSAKKGISWACHFHLVCDNNHEVRSIKVPSTSEF